MGNHDKAVGEELERIERKARNAGSFALTLYLGFFWCFPVSYPIAWFFTWRSFVWSRQLKALKKTEGWG